MADIEERKVQGLTVRIDRMACAGFKDCIKVAPEAFELGDDGVVLFAEPDEVERERLIEACRVCPAQALVVLDEKGNKIVPG